MTDSAAGETMNVAPGGRSMGRPPLAGGDAGRSRTNDRRDAEVAGSSPVRPVSSAARKTVGGYPATGKHASELGTPPASVSAQPWPTTNVPAVLREAANRLEQHPWLKAVEALRLWADVVEMLEAKDA